MRQFWISTKKTVLMSNPFRVSEQIDRTVRIVLSFCCPIGLHNAHHVSLVRKRFVFRSCQRPVALWRKQMFTKSYRTTYKPVLKPIIAKLSQSSSWSYDSWLKESLVYYQPTKWRLVGKWNLHLHSCHLWIQTDIGKILTHFRPK